MKTQRLFIALILVLGVVCCSCSSYYQACTPLSPKYYYCIAGDSVSSAPVVPHPNFATSGPSPSQKQASEKTEWINSIMSRSSIIPVVFILFSSPN